MSIYGNILFERAHEKVLNGMKRQDEHDIFLDWDFPISDLKYEITTSADEKSSVKDLVATGYSVDDGEKINFQDFNEPISDTIELSSNIKKRKIGG